MQGNSNLALSKTKGDGGVSGDANLTGAKPPVIKELFLLFQHIPVNSLCTADVKVNNTSLNVVLIFAL